MNAGQRVQRLGEQLDLVTVQAVLAYREAYRAVGELEREHLDNKTPTYRGSHAMKLSRARVALLSARAALESVFEVDS